MTDPPSLKLRWTNMTYMTHLTDMTYLINMTFKYFSN
jgi:hypothetical protein